MSDIQVSLTYACDGCAKPIAVPFVWHAGTIVPQASAMCIQLLEWDAEKKQLVNVELMPDVHHLVMCEVCRVEFTADIIACLMRIRDKIAQPPAEAVVVQ